MAPKYKNYSLNLDPSSIKIIDDYAKKNTEGKRAFAVRKILKEFAEK